MIHADDHVLEYVDDLLHGVLSPAEARQVERHVDACSICKAALEEARKRAAACETVPACETSEHLIQATLDKIREYEKNRPKRRKFILAGVLAAAASIFVLLGFNVYYLTLSPTPYDLTVLGQTHLLAGTVASLRIRVVDTAKKAPLAGVPVDIELVNRDTKTPRMEGIVTKLASFTTNAQGSGQPRFQLPDWADGDHQLRIVAQPNGKTEIVTRTIHLKRSWKLMLTSDKPVYQPGQEIHVRSLALRQPDLKPVTGQEAVFAVADPKGNIIFKQREATSKFGIAAADCALADEILEGPYAITCKIGDTVSKLTVDVKKYVLPKFKIDVELDKAYYEAGQKVKGKVQAGYFFGKPVAGGTVEVEVQAIDIPGTQSAWKHNLRLQADAKGAVPFDFTLPESLVGREQDSADARVELRVTVTDTAGQKQARSLSRPVTRRPLRVQVIPEGGQLVEGVANTIYLYASYADGRPAKARVLVTGVENELTTNALGVASFQLTPKAIETHLAIRVQDDHGRTGRQEVDLKTGKLDRDFLVRTDKAVYTGGETMHLSVLGGGNEPVFVDLLKNSQTILTETIDVTNGSGNYQFDLPPDLFGTVELSAYRFGSAGWPVRKTRVLYIRQAKQLQIGTTSDKPEYRPGGKAKLQLALTDTEGKPTAGALSLAGVDEAVFSVLEQSPGMERTFYTLEQELLKPVYAIYPWSPDLETSQPPEDTEKWENALFARTAQIEPEKDAKRQRLEFSTYPDKVRDVTETQKHGLDVLKNTWLTIAGCIFAACIGLGLVRLGKAFVEQVAREAEEGQGITSLQIVGFVCLLIVVCLVAVAAIGTNASSTFQKVAQTIGGGGDFSSFRSSKPTGWGGGETFLSAKSPIPSKLTVDRVPQSSQNVDSGASQVRIREWFPETLLWRPELITDDKGRASLDLDLADSITTWRLTASAVAADGRLGASQSNIRVFQPFFVDLNLPVALTRLDEVAVPVVVYNYLPKPQTVELKLKADGWFENQDQLVKRLDLAAHEVRGTSYRLKVTKVGRHDLEVTAQGAGVADAIKKTIEIVPDGRRIEHVFNGILHQPIEINLDVPADAIEGSPKAILKIYPSNFSQLVEGLDGIFRQPYGCFEQTSSTTYPNILALQYLRQTKKSVPEVEAKARQYIHLGYQRLLGFEVSGGGFDWFGRPPANRTLTAYGLMEFQDMAKVHDVDPRLIERTRAWLLGQQNTDGSWTPESHGLHDDPTRRNGLAGVTTTAYIAWAIHDGQQANSVASDRSAGFLLSQPAETIEDPHALALVCNALLATGTNRNAVDTYLARLASMKKTSPDSKKAWWEQSPGRYTTFYGSGRSGSVETTALAALAFIRSGNHQGSAKQALTWLVEQKDSRGTWYSTQATVLALKALLAGTGKSLGEDVERRIEIALENGFRQSIVIPKDQAEVMKQVDLSRQLSAGRHQLRVTESTGSAAGYQVAFRYHVPEVEKSDKQEPLQIQLNYDKTELKLNDRVRATATVINQSGQVAPMVILDLPIPAGFQIDLDDLAGMVQSGSIAKYQVNPLSAVIYLRGLEPGKEIKLTYHLKATMPVKVTAPAARAYEYYNPDRKGVASPRRLVVRAE